MPNCHMVVMAGIKHERKKHQIVESGYRRYYALTGGLGVLAAVAGALDGKFGYPSSKCQSYATPDIGTDVFEEHSTTTTNRVY
ncbi:hypothetical protein BS17DRAFT_880132 [Gyrodon lividus]|nr:hypothetical protein BS17DRAFT_880132 [Gyrodon lividus]